MATSVVRDHPEAVLCKEEHLSVPHVGIQGPAVRERNGRASAPILVVNLRSIFRGDSTHKTLSFFLLCRSRNFKFAEFTVVTFSVFSVRPPWALCLCGVETFGPNTHHRDTENT